MWFLHVPTAINSCRSRTIESTLTMDLRFSPLIIRTQTINRCTPIARDRQASSETMEAWFFGFMYSKIPC